MVEHVAGVAIGLKLVNGKLRPSKGKYAWIAAILFVILMIAFSVAAIVMLVRGNPEGIIPLIAASSTAYILSISRLFQKDSDYSITFPDGTLGTLSLVYKGKPVMVRYSLDREGLFRYADNAKKLDCVAYADGSPMSNHTKYKIINYLAFVLKSNDLLSKEVTVSYERKM